MTSESFPFWTADLNIGKTIRSSASAFRIYFTYIGMDEPNEATGEYYYENAIDLHIYLSKFDLLIYLCCSIRLRRCERSYVRFSDRIHERKFCGEMGKNVNYADYVFTLCTGEVEVNYVTAPDSTGRLLGGFILYFERTIYTYLNYNQAW